MPHGARASTGNKHFVHKFFAIFIDHWGPIQKQFIIQGVEGTPFGVFQSYSNMKLRNQRLHELKHWLLRVGLFGWHHCPCTDCGEHMYSLYSAPCIMKVFDLPRGKCISAFCRGWTAWTSRCQPSGGKDDNIKRTVESDKLIWFVVGGSKVEEFLCGVDNM